MKKDLKTRYLDLKIKKFDSIIKNKDLKSVFELNSIEAPQFWSQTAVDIAASKYFYRAKEKSVFKLIDRIGSGLNTALLQTKIYSKKDCLNKVAKIKEGMLLQKFAFNSPVWFNCGLYESYGIKEFKKPQTSACFIQSINDNLDSIYELLKTEALLFKYGSGSGTNFSNLRSKYEKLKSGGFSSGLISFLEIFDKSAGSIKSGGVTRRAAKMVCLDITHPEILEFINWKKNEEFKAHILISNGIDGSMDGEAYKTISGQNANNSVRLTDQFMKAVNSKSYFNLRYSKTNKIYKKIKAQKLWDGLCQAAWSCADPGVQFHDTINDMNTCKKSGPILASNPCSEYMFLDNSACNLASLNLIKYYDFDKSHFLFKEFCHDIDLLIRTQDSLVEYSKYPTELITKNSKQFRPLGLGFANLGSLLMQLGLAYDSDQARSLATAITSLMAGQSYLTSSNLAQEVGAFGCYQKNKKSVTATFEKQKNELKNVQWSSLVEEFKKNIYRVWNEADLLIKKYGLRNSQLTLIAPTGTIGLVMDCGTTGIEPDYALIKYKKLSGGGQIKMINSSVKPSLKKLGYLSDQIELIMNFILINNSVINAPVLKKEHLKVFQTASGENSISFDGHLLMMAAVQPFLSGAISKTVNIQSNATVKDISNIYMKAWKLKLKSVAIYRDQSKFVQPLNLNHGFYKVKALVVEKNSVLSKASTKPICSICGFETIKEASCFKCSNCGFTSSCIG